MRLSPKFRLRISSYRKPSDDPTPTSSQPGYAITEIKILSMEGHEFNTFSWNFRKRSRYAYFTQSTDLHRKVRASDLWSPLELFVNPRKKRAKHLEDAHITSPQDSSSVASSSSHGSAPCSTFCSRCANIDFHRIVLEAWITSSVTLSPFSSISLGASCRLCSVFSFIITNFVDDVIEDDTIFYLCPFYTSRIYAAGWSWDPVPAGVEETVSFAILDERTFREGSRVCQPEMIRATGWISPVETLKIPAKFSPRLLNVHVDFTVLRAWLGFCALHHTKTCSSRDSREMLPLRVIDCNSRMIIPATSSCQYLALSYVWGNSTASLGEDDSDLAKDQLPKYLPQTIEDAILTAKCLGYDYLWIDRYCIPQENNEERRQQIYQMNLVYNRAQATIIAAAGDEPNFGLPGVGNRLRAPSFSAMISNTSYVSVPPDPAHEIQGSKWNSRGWTHQETVLSKRRLIFCEDQVFFECSSMHCYESMDMPLKPLHTTGQECFSTWNEPGIFAPVTKRRHPLNEIFEQFAQYTKRDLSYSGDILNGMMGILAAFEHTYESFLHYGGVPIVPDVTAIEFHGSTRDSTRVEQFATGLCWKLDDPSLRRPGFPSWSWTGWHGVVSSLGGCDGYIENTYDIRFSVKSLGGISVEWETFCNSGIVNNTKQNLHVDAAVVRLRFQRFPANHKHRSGEYDSDLIALLETDDQSVARAACFLTRKMRGNYEVSQSLLRDKWHGIVLGTRHGTYFTGSEERRTMDNSDPRMVVMAVQVDGNKAERIGLVVFNTLIDEVDGVCNHFDLKHIPTTRRQLQLL